MADGSGDGDHPRFSTLAIAAQGMRESAPERAVEDRPDRVRRRSRSSARGALVLLCALGAGLGAAGWWVTDLLERDDDFCNACHLSEDVPLHIEIRRDFDARPPASLAAAHAAAAVRAREREPAFRCIDCHGGASAIGRLRVKALAAKDAFWYVVGRFEEPTHMAWPLWDEDCRRCHAEYSVRGGGLGPAFHELAVHNVELGVDCVECHLAHESGGQADFHFLHSAHVRRQCARCHPEFEEGMP
jgi:hypothetical protein